MGASTGKNFLFPLSKSTMHNPVHFGVLESTFFFFLEILLPEKRCDVAAISKRVARQTNKIKEQFLPINHRRVTENKDAQS